MLQYMHILPISLVFAFLAFYLPFKYYRRWYKGARYPPGPKPLPLLGNIFDIPKESAWLAYHRLAQEHGDVVHLSVFGQHIVILDSLEAVRDIMLKRAHIYSSRPILPMLGELIGWDFTTPLLGYGSTWRRHRRAFHQHFHINATGQFRSVQLLQTCELLLKLLDTPQKFRSHIAHWAAASIIEATYGFKVTDADDPCIKLINSAMESVDAVGLPGTFLVDVIPMLKYVPSWCPGAGFQIKAKRWRSLVQKATELPFQVSRSLLKNGEQVPISFATLALDKLQKNIDPSPDDEKIIKHVCATTYGGGSDTSASAMAVFFAAMALYPDVQRKAQLELQQVVGPDRLPCFDDMENLPFIRAIVKEILRWHPVACLAMPHTVMEDDTYKGYHIPRGAIILGNSWAILHNEKFHSDPHEFKPERFMKDGKIDVNVLDPAEVAFGFGRRQCPGKHFAQNGLSIGFAMILSCFNIGPGQDADGNPVPVILRMGTNLASHPQEFNCSVTPRFDAVRKLINRCIEGYVVGT